MYKVVLYQKTFEDGRQGWEFRICCDNQIIYDSYSEEYNGLIQPLSLSDALEAVEEYFQDVIPNEIKEG